MNNLYIILVVINNILTLDSTKKTAGTSCTVGFRKNRTHYLHIPYPWLYRYGVQKADPWYTRSGLGHICCSSLFTAVFSDLIFFLNSITCKVHM